MAVVSSSVAEPNRQDVVVLTADGVRGSALLEDPGAEFRERAHLRQPLAALAATVGRLCQGSGDEVPGSKVGAGNGIRTRDFDLGKVALYH